MNVRIWIVIEETPWGDAYATAHTTADGARRRIVESHRHSSEDMYGKYSLGDLRWVEPFGGLSEQTWTFAYAKVTSLRSDTQDGLEWQWELYEDRLRP